MFRFYTPRKYRFQGIQNGSMGELKWNLTTLNFFRIKEIVLNKVLKETKKLLSKVIFKRKDLCQISVWCKSLGILWK